MHFHGLYRQTYSTHLVQKHFRFKTALMRERITYNQIHVFLICRFYIHN